MEVFEFAYSECIHESGCVTQSIHKTRKGAEMALDYHKSEELKQFNECKSDPENAIIMDGMEFGEHEAWIVRETELKK